MKKLCTILMLLITLMVASGCGSSKEKVIIYTNIEDMRIEKVHELLSEKYPDIDVSLQYYSTGSLAAKINAEGKNIEADIVWGVDLANATLLKDNFADLSKYDTSKYLDEFVYDHNKFHTWTKEAGCIILNTKVLAEKGLDEPQSYEDLLDKKYKDLIVMPNPKSSGTGYFFLNSLVTNWGEEAALEYFDKLSKNVKQFSESGSGPVKSLDKGEIAIGLGMTFQAVDYANDNKDLKIVYFDEGSPYNIYVSSIIDGKQDNENVDTIYSYMLNDYFFLDKELFNPEVVYKDQEINVEGYPKDIKYSKMTSLDSYEYRENLLDKWKW